MTVRAARTYQGFQALFCDRLGNEAFLGLSSGAKGFLLLLRLWADRSVLRTRNTSDHGKIFDEELGRFWVGADAEAWFGEVHAGEGALAAGFMGELRVGGFVRGDYDEEVVVLDFVEDDLRKSGNLRRGWSGERAGGDLGRLGGGEGEEVDGRGGRSGRSHAPAGGRRSSPPPSSGPMVPDDGHWEDHEAVGGKGGVSSNNMIYGKQQTLSKPSNPNFQTPYQTARDGQSNAGDGANANVGDGLRMEGRSYGGGDEGEFYAIIHNRDIFTASQFACRQSDPVFRKAFEARLAHYGQGVVREALEYVGLQVHRNPTSISREYWKDGHPIGGPLLWRHLEKVAASRGIGPYVKKERMGIR